MMRSSDFLDGRGSDEKMQPPHDIDVPVLILGDRVKHATESVENIAIGK